MHTNQNYIQNNHTEKMAQTLKYQWVLVIIVLSVFASNFRVSAKPGLWKPIEFHRVNEYGLFAVHQYNTLNRKNLIFRNALGGRSQVVGKRTYIELGVKARDGNVESKYAVHMFEERSRPNNGLYLVSLQKMN